MSHLGPLHAQMDDTAEQALRTRLPAEAITEFGPHTQPRRLRPWQRLARWWRVGQLRAELAGLEADREALLLDLSDDAALKLANPARWHNDAVQHLHLGTLHELSSVRERIKAKRIAIHQAGGHTP